MSLCLKNRNICHFDKRMMYICRKQKTRVMKAIINPERLVSVPFNTDRQVTVGLRGRSGLHKARSFKIFPGDVLGAKLVKGLLAPMPWSKLMVTGGVEPTQENLTSWIKAGVFCVGMGSKLFPNDKVAAEDWTYVTEKCKEALAYIAEARK